MLTYGARMRPFAFTACALIAAFCSRFWDRPAIAVAARHSDAKALHSQFGPSASRKDGVPKPTLIFPALLAEYYDHGREHAPPRSPGGVMQRRELFYRAPNDPFDLIESHLRSNAEDNRFHADLRTLRKRWMAGDELDTQFVAALGEDAERSTISGIVLINAGRGFQWLVNDRLACALFSAGLHRAWSEVQATHDAARLELLHAIDQTRVLWNASDPESLVCRFRIARQLTPPLSIDSRRAGYHLAESLLADGHFDEAADLILQVQAEHQRVGDLGMCDSSDIPEMNLVTGMILFNASRHHAAIPYLAAVRGDQAKQAYLLLFECYLRTEQFEQASKLLGPIHNFDLPAPHQPRPLIARLDEELTRARWRIEHGALPANPQ
jgi:hypothetical protein